MKTNHSLNWIRIGLLRMALALVVILMTIPSLSKGISNIIDEPIGPEKLASHITTIHAEYRDRGFDKRYLFMEFATRN
jgi:hypothetical protein